jgi:hypothetical protein
MHSYELLAGSVVPRRSERVAAHEKSLLRPPKRDLLPTTVCADLTEDERSERLARHHMVRHAEPLGERSAVAVVAVEQLDDAGRLTRGADPIHHSLPVDRIDEPDLVVHYQRMGAAFEELALDEPLETCLELSERDPHCGESTGTP